MHRFDEFEAKQCVDQAVDQTAKQGSADMPMAGQDINMNGFQSGASG